MKERITLSTKTIIRLASRVLVVASVNEPVGDWSAYIDAVPGMNHEREWQDVAKIGTKLPQDHAEFLFPQFKHLRYRS